MSLKWFRKWTDHPTPTPASLQINQYYEESQFLRRKIEAKDRELNQLRRDNQYIRNSMKALNHRHLVDAETIRRINDFSNELSEQHLVDSEKIHRLSQLLAEAREGSLKVSMQHREEIGELYNRINSLQLENGALDDDSVVTVQRRSTS